MLALVVNNEELGNYVDMLLIADSNWCQVKQHLTRGHARDVFHVESGTPRHYTCYV